MVLTIIEQEVSKLLTKILFLYRVAKIYAKFLSSLRNMK